MCDLKNKKDDPRQKVVIVAEIGINHNGDMDLARQSIIAAAEAGADSVKFQNYKTEDFITDRGLIFEYQSQGRTIKEPQYDMFKRCELSPDKLRFLMGECHSAGVLFHSTPTSVEGIKDLQNVGCNILKNGSDFLTNLRLIRAMGETGLKTVLSTGMATLSEIDNAVRAFYETGNENLMLLHCTSSYPTPPEDVNLARIAVLRDAFNVDVGFSDHSNGTTAAVGATILGAKWIEKHFTLRKDLPGPDHWFSMDSNELKELVLAVREAESMVGSSRIGPTVDECRARRNFRLSCVASRDISEGECIEPNDITFHRPGEGLSPALRVFWSAQGFVVLLKKGKDLKWKIFMGECFSNCEPIWEDKYSAGHRQRYPWDLVVSFVFQNLPSDRPFSEVKIMEIGFGTAPNLWFAAREGFQVSGIEGSKSAVDVAREKFKSDGLCGDLRVGDFTNLPFENDEFDLIIDRASMVCVGLQGHNKTVAEVHRCLRKGGRFLHNVYSDRHSSMRSGSLEDDGLIGDIKSGTLVGTGRIHFSSRLEIDERFKVGWKILQFELREGINLLSTGGDRHSEFVVVAEKT